MTDSTAPDRINAAVIHSALRTIADWIDQTGKIVDELAPLDNASPVYAEIYTERARQDAKWGEQNHPDGTGGRSREEYADSDRRWCQQQFAEGTGAWVDVLQEEVSEAFACKDAPALRAELVQVAAVAVAWIEAIDRRSASDLGSTPRAENPGS